MSNYSTLPSKRSLLAVALAIAASMYLATSAELSIKNLKSLVPTNEIHAAKNKENFILNDESGQGHKKNKFIHHLLCYVRPVYEDKYYPGRVSIAECPAGRDVIIYNYETSRTVPEQKGKFIAKNYLKFTQSYGYEFFTPTETQEGRICTNKEDCVPFKTDIKWIKKCNEAGHGHMMVTGLIFDENLNLEGTVDLTPQIFYKGQIKVHKARYLEIMRTNMDAFNIFPSFVLDNE